MGQRANMVVVRDGAWRLYYDHWCAGRLDVELFWGPEPATEFIEQRAAVDNDDWLDEVWCEGAAIVDHDRRVLVFFGGEKIAFDVPLRRAQLALMGETWPGWTIRWANEGIVTIGAYLELPSARFLDTCEADPQERFRAWSDPGDPSGTLLTVKKDGVTTARHVTGDEESLRLGPTHLDILREVAGAPSLEITGDMPTGGVHLDFDTREAAVWWADWAPVMEARFTAAWPGWTIEWLGDRYERHIALAGIDIRLPETPCAALQTKVIEGLRVACHSPASNPALDLLKKDPTTRINPATNEARGSVGDESAKRRILDDLASRLPIGLQ